MINDSLPAHVVPIDLSAVPEIVRMTAAELAAGRLLSLTGGASENLAAVVDRAHKRLERWGKGVPVRGAVVPPSANLAHAATAPFRDRRGWWRFGGL
jgi:hypothetical protein